MYIYLDETFNLKKGTKNQFLAIAGYETQDPKKLIKLFLKIKSAKLPKKWIGSEIKSANIVAEKLIKPYLFQKLSDTDISIYSNLQYKNYLPRKYFKNEVLNYDLLYLDLLKDLLTRRWSFKDNKIIILTLDTFKTKKISKREIISSLKTDLALKYPNKTFDITFESSASFLNLQIADFVCGIFYDWVLGNKKWFRSLKYHIKKITLNPLK